MRAKHWLIGLVLGMAGIGSVAAASIDTQDIDNGAHAGSDNPSSHDNGGASCSDVLGLGHECAAHGSAGDSGNSGTNTPHDHAGGTTPAAPVPVHPAHLGWQSLVPGSIQ
jgi:hypothetical protein